MFTRESIPISVDIITTLEAGTSHLRVALQDTKAQFPCLFFFDLYQFKGSYIRKSQPI
jgi:hypothetical protein